MNRTLLPLGCLVVDVVAAEFVNDAVSIVPFVEEYAFTTAFFSRIVKLGSIG
jgi:hypothetical protein